MRIHHLNCVSLCPLGGVIVDGRSHGLRARLACHCLLVETPGSLVLIDTGFGLRDVYQPRSRLSSVLLAQLRPELREEMTAIRQIRALGFDPRDVRHIVLTHLDFDHAGGLDDFPHADVHLLAAEREAATHRRTVLDRARYRPQQWKHRDNWQTYPPSQGEPWYGFDAVRGLRGVPDEILLVPLVGHTFGHTGVAVRRRHDWLLMAGDAYFHRDEMRFDDPDCPPALRLHQTLMEKDRAQRLRNQQRLRELRRLHGDVIEITCSHDPVEFELLANRPLGTPAERAPEDAENRPFEPVPLGPGAGDTAVAFREAAPEEITGLPGRRS